MDFTYQSEAAPVNQLLQPAACFQHLLTEGTAEGTTPTPPLHTQYCLILQKYCSEQDASLQDAPINTPHFQMEEANVL